MVRFGPTEGKKNNLSWFLIGVYLPAIAVYLLVASRSLSDYIATSFFITLSAITLIVLFIIKSDDEYYRVLSASNLLGAIILALVMTFVSYGLSNSVFQNNSMLLSVSEWSVLPQATSTVTIFLSTILFGLVMAATAEELFRLPFFAEGRHRWNRGIKLGAISVPGWLIYVGFPVIFWACLHGIQAYTNPVMIIPAAVNGILLTVYLWKTKCILGCIFAHWGYNTGITTILYVSGQTKVAAGTPLFPNLLSANYWQNSGFIIDFLLVAIVAWGFIFFLLPSLRSKNSI